MKAIRCLLSWINLCSRISLTQTAKGNETSISIYIGFGDLTTGATHIKGLHQMLIGQCGKCF